MHNGQNNLVSVIVPVYKVEEYLRECIDSIINQTYKNLEIILVDDGSPDKCGEICEEYARNDSRITVYHKENGGLSDARNYGIKRCNGEYITFVDSDDVIKANLVETLMVLIHKYDADVSASSCVKFTKLPDWSKSSQAEDYSLSTHDIMREMLYQGRAGHGAYAKIYSREVWSDAEFPKGIYYEDAATIYKIIFRSRRIALTYEKLYGYRTRHDSQSKSSVSPKILDVIPVSQQYYSAVTERFPDLKRAASSRAFSLNRSAYLTLPFSSKKERMQLWEEMKKYRSAIIFDPKARKRERIAALLSYLGADIFHILFSKLYMKWQLTA